MLAIIDGDIVTFRAAFSAEEEPEPYIACARANTMVEEILLATGATEYKVFISGEKNFRYDVYPEYKANRLNAKRPKWEKDVKAYLEINWDAERSEGCEADDLMGLTQVSAQKQGKESCIATIDKDLDQIPGWHYNFVKKEKYFITPEQALIHFYYQCLVGDTADGIKGVPGIGPKKASRILSQCESEREMFAAVREAYGNDEEFAMNAKVLYIWKQPNDIWKWPKHFEGMEQST